MVTPVHIQQRKIAWSRIGQTNYTTPTAAAANAFNELLVSDQNLSQYSVATANNQGYSTQNDFPTDQWLLSHNSARQFELDLASDPVGRVLHRGCGSISTSQPASGTDPLVYRHVIVPQDPNTSRQLVASSWVEIVGGAINHLYPGGVIDTISFRGAGVDRIKGSFSVVGSGKRIKPSGVTWASHVNQVTGWKYFTNSVCDLTIADAGTLSNSINYSTENRLETWQLDYSNQLLGEEGYRPGATALQTPGDVTSGAVRSELLFGTRTIRPQFVVRVDANSDEYAALQSQKDLDYKVVLTGPIISTTYAHKLTIRGYLSRYAAVEYGRTSGGIITVGITPTLLWDTSTGKIIDFTLDNTVSSYTT